MSQLNEIAAAASQFLNTLLKGKCNSTVSARCYRNRRKPKWKLAYNFVNKLFYKQKDHCRDSFKDDVEFMVETLEYCINNNEEEILLEVLQSFNITIEITKR